MLMPKIVINADLLSSVPDSRYFLELADIRGRFSSSDFIIVSVQSENLYDENTLRRVSRLSSELSNMAGIDTVVSVSTLSDIVTTEDTIEVVPLLGADQKLADTEDLKTSFERTAIFKELLISRDETAWNIYVFSTESGNVDVSEMLEKITEMGHTREQIFGIPVLKFYIKEGIKRDVMLLLACGVVIVFILQWAFSKRILAAVYLWLTSLVPTLWVLGLFPIFGVELQLHTIFVPVEVLALSTSYGIHILRYSSAHPSLGMPEVLNHTSPIILIAAISTMAGFTTLLFSDLSQLRNLGLFTIGGIAFSLLSALFFLPVLLARCNLPPHSGIKTAGDRRNGSWFGLITIFLGCVVVFVSVGIGRIFIGSSIGELFWNRSRAGRAVQFFNEHHGGVEEVEIFIRPPGEYPLVNLETYYSIRKITEELVADPGVNRVFSYIDFVEWSLGRFSGTLDSIRPESDADIGEMLELLSSQDFGINLSSLIDSAYATALLRIRLNTAGADPKGLYDILAQLEQTVPTLFFRHLPQASFTFAGAPREAIQISRHTISAQIIGILLFFPFLALILFLVYRRVRWVVICLVPSVLGALFFLGIVGWAAVPLRTITGICLALVLGVSVDDVVYFTMFYRSIRSQKPAGEALQFSIKLAGTAIIQTTLIIDLGLSVLLLSSYRVVAQVALLAICTLTFCTAVTFFFVPAVINYLQARAHKKETP